jgi:hypothetical protein
MVDENHEGTLEQADTGWWYVQCSCGWYSARGLNNDAPWTHHANHQFGEASALELRRQIHGPDAT